MTNIKRLRRECGLRQADIAEMLGVGRTTISNWETGYSRPDLDATFALMKIFNCSMDNLFRVAPAEGDSDAQVKLGAGKESLTRIKALRQECGLKQSDIASLLDVGQTTISNWETGYSEPNIAALKNLAYVFECSVDDILSSDVETFGDMEISQKKNSIKKIRIDKGIKQGDLADMLKVKQATVSGWESGRREPDIESLKRMSVILDCSIDELLGNKEKPVVKDDELSRKLSRLSDENLQRMEDYVDLLLKTQGE